MTHRQRQGEQDYLRVILEISQHAESPVKSTDIAKKLKVSKPSVSEMLRKLASSNLIEFSPYSQIRLTRKGEKQAKEIREKHELIERFAQKIGHTNPHNEAHNLEHSFSEEMLQRLREFVDGKRKIEANPPVYIG